GLRDREGFLHKTQHLVQSTQIDASVLGPAGYAPKSALLRDDRKGGKKIRQAHRLDAYPKDALHKTRYPGYFMNVTKNRRSFKRITLNRRGLAGLPLVERS
ncbi:MAG: hypothetical protein IIB38_17410, partial [Candidatus Hydrogenedentes bacterium]|nr:hypothetical protein [Candidatus Hydrogenedentota bacterium]